MTKPSTASCVLIGNELLSGKIRDSNAYFLARWLRERGVDLQRIQVVPDVIDVMAEAILAESRRSTWVFTSGGIGPTHDDLTYQGVAHAFGRSVKRHDVLKARMEAWYGGPQSDVRLRMADLPHPCELIDVEGLWVPVVKVENVLVLPGIPQLFEKMVLSLGTVVAEGTPVTLCSVYTRQIEEQIAPALEQVLVEFPGVEIGSYPRVDTDEYKVRVTLESRDRALVHAAVEALVKKLDETRLVRVER